MKELYQVPDGDFYLPTDIWAKVVYDYSTTFHAGNDIPGSGLTL